MNAGSTVLGCVNSAASGRTWIGGSMCILTTPVRGSLISGHISLVRMWACDVRRWLFHASQLHRKSQQHSTEQRLLLLTHVQMNLIS